MLFYLIKTDHNEYNADYDYIATSLEEAESHLMEFANFYCNPGDCRIDVVDERFHVIDTREYRGGKLMRKRRW